MSNIDTNKATVRAYYETAFAGQPEQAVQLYMGDRYIQHNPQADNGPAAFIRFVHDLRTQYPQVRLDIKRIFTEGDFVVTHSHLILKPGDPGRRWLISFAWRRARSWNIGMSFNRSPRNRPTKTRRSRERR
jgi:predicted SnoaL-like aldol condensation-catalyzing enzyme